MWLDFDVRGHQKMTFSLEEALLWIIRDYFSWLSNGLKLKHFNDGFVSHKHSFSMNQTLTDGLEWCGLLWCFYQLFGLSFWRHPFTAEDSLVSKWCNATFIQICSDGEKTHLDFGWPGGGGGAGGQWPGGDGGGEHFQLFVFFILGELWI